MNKAPAFFKFFITECSSIDMKIPEAFTRRIKHTLPETVLLRDRHNKIWRVKVAKVGDCWFFVDGWDKFVDDNSLTSGDLVVFKYFSDGDLFSVRLYGPSATEKNAVGPSTPKGVVKHEQGSQHRHDTNNVDDHDDETESERCDYVFMRRDRDNEDDRDEEERRNVPTRREENERKGVAPGQNNDDGVGASRSTWDRLIQLYPKCYGMEIFKAGLAQQPQNPYFVAKIMPKRRSDLFIPMDVIKDYNLNLEREIILVDPRRREFRTKSRKWKDGRSIISGGWRRLCRANFVTLDDSCICEFVPREGDPRLFLHISVIRADMVPNHSHRN